MRPNVPQAICHRTARHITSACAQQAAFVSTPPGAQVFIDGQEIGVTPCAFDYNLGKNDSHEVTIAKQGYDPVNFVVVTDEVDTAARSRWLRPGSFGVLSG